MTSRIATRQAILVAGGGTRGTTAALEAADVGHEVVPVGRDASLVGRTALLRRTFPATCRPACGLEIGKQASTAT